jgi:hypothetical protein
MSENLDRIGGSLINAVLGALILWVGQTTFRHAGLLAGIDQKFVTVDQQVANVSERYDSLRSWLDKVVNNIKDDSRLQFTTTDAEKLVVQFRKLDDFTAGIERRLTDRLTSLEVKLAALETHDANSQQIAALQAEVAQLRYAMAQPIASPDARYQQATTISQQPVYLPPVGARR